MKETFHPLYKCTCGSECPRHERAEGPPRQLRAPTPLVELWTRQRSACENRRQNKSSEQARAQQSSLLRCPRAPDPSKPSSSSNTGARPGVRAERSIMRPATSRPATTSVTSGPPTQRNRPALASSAASTTVWPTTGGGERATKLIKSWSEQRGNEQKMRVGRAHCRACAAAPPAP